MTTAHLCIMITIIVYLCFVILTGLMIGRKSKSGAEGFYLGGRSVGPLVTAMSAEASDMSSWLLMGLPGVAYLSGVAEAGWTAIGLALGTYLNFLLVAKRLRRYSVELGAITIPDFLAKRYRDNSKIIKSVCAFIILIFFVPYVASGFVAIAKLFNSLLGWDYTIAVIIGAVVIVSYTTVGGFSAVATMDLIQSIIMTTALVVIVFFGIHQAGGMDTIIENCRNTPGYFGFFDVYDPVTKSAMPYNFSNVVTLLGWGLGYFGMPHILVRFMAIRDENELKLSRRIAGIWVVISMGISIFIGMIGYNLSLAGKVPLLEGSASETIIVKISDLLATYGVIPALFASLILAGILAATMSTADSQLLCAASSFSEDFLRDVMGVKLSDKQIMWTARGTVIGMTVIAAFFALDPDSSIFRIISFAWAGIGATIAPAMLFSLYWKRSNRHGIIAGLTAGAVTVVAWKLLVRPLGGFWDLYELLPAFIVASICIVVFSLATAAPNDEIISEFDRMRS